MVECHRTGPITSLYQRQSKDYEGELRETQGNTEGLGRPVWIPRETYGIPRLGEPGKPRDIRGNTPLSMFCPMRLVL